MVHTEKHGNKVGGMRHTDRQTGRKTARHNVGQNEKD